MIKWRRKGGYECSSAGDKRFSAFHARLGDGRTIEEHYQCDVKGYDIGGTNWRLGKGKKPLSSMSQEELYERYLDLWEQWAVNNLHLLNELMATVAHHNYTLSDMFANGPVNQARALADILNKRLMNK